MIHFDCSEMATTRRRKLVIETTTSFLRVSVSASLSAMKFDETERASEQNEPIGASNGTSDLPEAVQMSTSRPWRGDRRLSSWPRPRRRRQLHPSWTWKPKKQSWMS